MANPTKLTWIGPSTYTDNSPFGEADLAGFEIQVEGLPSVNVPTAWNVDNTYEYDIATLGLGYGTFSVTLATVARNGQVSAPSNAVTFTLEDTRVPNPPQSLAVV